MSKLLLVTLFLAISPLAAQQTEADYRRQLNTNPKNLQAYLGLIELANTRAALTQLATEATEAIGPRSAIQVELGNSYLRINDINNAVISYQQAIAMNPRSAVTYNRLGLALLRLKNFRQAEVAFKAGISLTANASSKAIYYTNLAQSYEGLQSYEEAKKAIEQALVSNPQYQAALTFQTRLRSVAPQVFQ